MNKKPIMLVVMLCALPAFSAFANVKTLTLKQALINTEQQNPLLSAILIIKKYSARLNLKRRFRLILS
ncbi:hypothetical protein PSM_A2481 [Pseudoalteromonas sp. SM9913]|jgi:hypothetical protein|nr:hypothetical protein PSM_A2481 [Pseudoalteromonas sp. SM9913]